MGAAYFVETERPIPKLKKGKFYGKALAHLPDAAVKKLCKKLKVASPGSFVGQSTPSPKKMVGIPEDVAADLMAISQRLSRRKTKWFEADTGLRMASRLAAALKEKPELIDSHLVDAAVTELSELEKILEQCRREKVRWHLGLDP